MLAAVLIQGLVVESLKAVQLSYSDKLTTSMSVCSVAFFSNHVGMGSSILMQARKFVTVFDDSIVVKFPGVRARITVSALHRCVVLVPPPYLPEMGLSDAIAIDSERTFQL